MPSETIQMDAKSRIGHRQRLRTKFQQTKLLGMQDYEALEYLLTFVLPRCDTKPIAKELLQHFGSLACVFDAPVQELSHIHGVGPRAAGLLALIKEITSMTVVSTPVPTL